jgi:hypothetical protein
MKFIFNKFYFICTLLLLATEILIALYTTNWIRAYFGDFLVVILLYSFIMSFVSTNKNIVLIGVLLFSYLVEILQYYQFVEVIGWQNYSIANTLIGTSFSWIDMLMYTLGVLFVAIIEQLNSSSIFFIKPKRITNG